MRRENIILVAIEPVLELKPGSELLQRLARVLYYHRGIPAHLHEEQQEGADALHSGDKTAV